MTYDDLIVARKACRLCMEGDGTKLRNGSDYDFDPDVVSYWSQWLGSRTPKLLLVGQDFGDWGYFERHRGRDEVANQTNENLAQLLALAGLPVGSAPDRDPAAPVYLTNAILCLKAPPMNRAIGARWVSTCTDQFLSRLISLLDPPIVVGMGGHGWRAVRRASSLQDAPLKISEAAGRGSWHGTNGKICFAVGHCGPLGLVNRPWPLQMQDWRAIGSALDQLGNKRPKEP